MTADPRIEAACIAYCRESPNYCTSHYPGDTTRKWRASSGYVGDTYQISPTSAASVRTAITAALAAADAVARDDNVALAEYVVARRVGIAEGLKMALKYIGMAPTKEGAASMMTAALLALEPPR